MDTDVSSSHSGYCFTGQAITCFHGYNDILASAYFKPLAASEATKDNSVEQFPNAIAADTDLETY